MPAIRSRHSAKVAPYGLVTRRASTVSTACVYFEV